MRGELGPPLALGDVAQGQTQTLTLDAYGDQPDALPGVEPAVQEPQLGLGSRDLEEAEGGAEMARRRDSRGCTEEV
jgi:hypothetical protein